MSKLPSMSSIERPVTSSGGRFDLDCGTHYNRSHWAHEEWHDDWTVEIAFTAGRVLRFHGQELRVPDFSTLEEKRDFALRRVCHVLIDRIDAKGLAEVCQSLVEFYDFYRPTDASGRFLPATSTKDATIGSRVVSPAFRIEGE